MTHKIVTLISFLLLYAFSGKGAQNGSKDIDNAKDSTLQFITAKKVNGKVLLNIPAEILGREMLFGTTITATSDNGNGIVGSKPHDPFLVIFTRENNNIALRMPDSWRVSTSETLNDDNETDAIFKLFKIKEFSKDSSIMTIDATELFISDDSRLSPIDRYGKNSSGSKKVTGTLQKKQSYIESVSNFSGNLSVKSCLSYKCTKEDSGKEWQDRPFTTSVTRSFLLLPKQPSKPKITDSRIAIFPTEKVLLDSNKGAKKIYYANIWNPERRKELTFYLDTLFPKKWLPYIKEGIEQWNELFAEVGFPNFIKAIPFPTKGENPNFDADNLKYNCIRYAPIAIKNAMGPSWIDPRSGEIINASVYVYHDVMELLNNWLFVQTSQVDRRARHKIIPNDILGDALRYVISHEIGHCLGFMHNMSASAAYPTDSLRSRGFTQKNGTTTSIMDYARFNYIAQPEDSGKGLKLTPPRFGEYDRFLVRWAYGNNKADNRGIEGLNTGELLKSALNDYKRDSEILKEAYKEPVYRYGKQQLGDIVDPRSQTEDLGDDAIKASRYGVKNLKYILSNMDSWLAGEDRDMSYRKGICSSIMSQYVTYLGHVYAYVGGIELYEKFEGDTHQRVVPVDARYQENAVKFLLEQLDDLSWINLMDRYDTAPQADSTSQRVRAYLMDLIMLLPQKTTLCSAKATDLGLKPFTPQSCLNLISDYVWGGLQSGRSITDNDIVNQQLYLGSLGKKAGIDYPAKSGKKAALSGLQLIDICKVMYKNATGGEVQSYTEPGALYFDENLDPKIAYNEIIQICKLLKKRAKSSDPKTAAYCTYTLKKLEESLND